MGSAKEWMAAEAESRAIEAMERSRDAAIQAGPTGWRWRTRETWEVARWSAAHTDFDEWYQRGEELISDVDSEIFGDDRSRDPRTEPAYRLGRAMRDYFREHAPAALRREDVVRSGPVVVDRDQIADAYCPPSTWGDVPDDGEDAERPAAAADDPASLAVRLEAALGPAPVARIRAEPVRWTEILSPAIVRIVGRPS